MEGINLENARAQAMAVVDIIKKDPDTVGCWAVTFRSDGRAQFHFDGVINSHILAGIAIQFCARHTLPNGMIDMVTVAEDGKKIERMTKP